MPRNVKIRAGIAQIDVKLADLSANMDKHLEMIAEARKDGVELLVFPELSLSGYEVNPLTLDIAMTSDHEVFDELKKAAGKKMTVVAGFVEEGVGTQFYNSAIVMRPGYDDFIHRKLNLCDFGLLEEGKTFAEGRYVETVNLKQPYIAAVNICNDLWNPALVQMAMWQGATMMITPINSATEGVSSEFSNPSGWSLVLQFYAMVYGMPVIAANRVGTEGKLYFWGGSRILDPFGNPYVQAEGDEEALLVTDMPYNDVRKARFQLPTVRDSNFDLVLREMKRLSGYMGVPIGIRREERDPDEMQ